jgi:hypothetical protein
MLALGKSILSLLTSLGSFVAGGFKKLQSHRRVPGYQSSMAVVDPLEGAFVLIGHSGNPAEWDECLVICKIEGLNYLTLTTGDSVPYSFQWTELECTPGTYRVMTGVDATRTTPLIPAIDANSVYFISEGNNL